MKKNKTKGFTLVEVMVAMLVLAIGLLGLAAMTVVVLRSNLLSQQISEATTITGDLMETLQIQAFSSLTDCTTGLEDSLPSDCNIIRESGVLVRGDNFMPTEDVTCGIDGVLEDFSSGDPGTFDTVDAQLSAEGATSNSNFCTQFNSLAKGRYVRYYRITDAGSGARRLVVVTLWKDRFNKWRHIALETERSN